MQGAPEITEKLCSCRSSLVVQNYSRYVFSAPSVAVVLLCCATAMGSGSVELNGSASDAPRIIDIRSDTAGFELKKDVLAGLHPVDGGEKTLPTLLLYDDKGLKLFEEITYLEQYYLTGQGMWMENNAFVKHCNAAWCPFGPAWRTC